MSLGYVVKEGLAGIKRARLAAFTSMFSLFVAVLLLGVLSRVSFNVYEIARSIRNSIDVEVFLQNIDQGATDHIRQEIEGSKIVASIHYISKDSAAAIFRKQFGAEGSSLADLEFLPASFRLKIKPNTDVKEIRSLIKEVKGYRGVDEVKFNQQLLELLEARFQNVVLTGSGIGLLILLAALVLVYNTIRLTIYAKRDLIKAMKLVGATNGFIRRPFLVEGITQGIIAGILSVGMMYLAFHYVIPAYVPQFGILDWPFGRWYYLSGAMLLLALVMGLVGSNWAARKFIRETSISAG